MCALCHQWYSENEGGNGAAPFLSHGHECHKGSHSRPTLPKRGQSRRVSAAGRALSPHPARHAGQGCSRGASSLRKVIGCPGTPRLGATRERPVSRVREAGRTGQLLVLFPECGVRCATCIRRLYVRNPIRPSLSCGIFRFLDIRNRIHGSEVDQHRAPLLRLHRYTVTVPTSHGFAQDREAV